MLISSFPPPAWGPGGLAGHVGEPQARSYGDNTRYLGNHRTGREVIEALKKQVRESNGGKPLDEITFDSHGGPGVVGLGDRTGWRVSTLVKELMQARVLKPGGTLILTGCLIGRDAVMLQKTADHFKVTIAASTRETSFNNDASDRIIFQPRQGANKAGTASPVR